MTKITNNGTSDLILEGGIETDPIGGYNSKLDC
jgi:hypothetical protein